MERDDEMGDPGHSKASRSMEEADEAAEADLSKRAVGPDEPAYPEERSTLERVNDALHRSRRKGTRDR